MISVRDIYKIIPICVAILALGACVEEDVDAPAVASDGISFGISEPIAWPDDMSPRSRAEERAVVSKMGCYAFINSERTLLISNGRYDRNAQGVYTSKQVTYWPGAHTTLDFYNYAPYDVVGLEFDSTFGSPSFSYVIPKVATDRYDLLVASARDVPGDFNRAKDLTFKHALTAVNIRADKSMGNVQFDKIVFTGVHCGGKITFDDNGDVIWSLPAEEAKDEFEFTFKLTNYLVPQDLDGAMMIVDMKRNGDEITVTAPLKTSLVPEWLPGKSVKYILSMPEPTVAFDSTPEIDAHYSLCRTTIHVNSLAADRRWTLTAEASDGADVTVQHYEDVNELAKAGYWTDKYMENGSPTEESARGSASIDGVGNGDFDLILFAPENVSHTDRTITLSVTMQGESDPVATQSFKQLCPDWDNGGWERVDDNELGMYGLYYTTKHVYVYKPYNQNGHIGMINSINALAAYNNAGSYTNVQEYSFNTSIPEWGYYITNRRFYVEIDYSRLNALSGRAQSETDGLANTRELFAHGGSGITRTFESALQAMRLNDGSPAFRHRSAERGDAYDPDNPVDHDPYPQVPEEIGGEYISGSQVLVYVLKKNRYNIDRINDTSLGRLELPILSRDDIVWYMPASGEFGSFGSWPRNPSEIWSSTATSNDLNAKNGSGTSVSRTTFLGVRARRAPVSSAP